MTLPGDWYSKKGAATSKALPAGAKLIKVGNQYRVVWGLGDGLGWAWYSVSSTQVKALFGSANPVVNASLSNSGQFTAAFGNNYWGDASEIDLKAETPWMDLKNKIFNQFGYVPGFDTPEIKKLLLQAYFEKWTPDQWTVEYRNTQYFKTTTDQQRKWVGLSTAEQNSLVQEQTNEMTAIYRQIWGTDPNRADLAKIAFKVASGQLNLNQWELEQRNQAARRAGTPEYARRQEEQREAAEGVNRVEDLTLFAEDQYRAWVGPGNLPQGWAQQWGAQLATGAKSEADLENYLKTLSQSRWQFKPPDLTWQDWAAGYKAQIGDTLELGVVNDADPLLNQILRSDLNGVDLDQMIRGDQRFKSTQKMYGELADYAGEMGRRFGFIT